MVLSEARVQKEDRTAKANSKVRTGDKIQIAYLRRPEKPLLRRPRFHPL